MKRQKIADVRSAGLNPDVEQLYKNLELMIWNVAIASHAAVKGLLGHMGAGGAVTKEVVGVKTALKPEEGYSSLKKQIIRVLKDYNLNDGDVIVTSEKIFAVSQKRLIPLSIILKDDPKKISLREREKLVKKLQPMITSPLTAMDLIMADTYINSKSEEKATLGAYNPNKIAYELAKEIKSAYGKNVDVIISDTDTGIDVTTPLIGCITIGATPLGATKGLCLYECMRAALAAEFTRGSGRGIPIVICRPNKRSRCRDNIGKFRGYNGRLDYKKEGAMSFDI